MRRKLAILGVLAVAAATAVVAAAIASGSPGPKLAAPATVVVIEHATSDTVADIAPRGDSDGDVLVFGNRVFDKTDARAVGRDQGYCLRISAQKGRWECAWTTFLAAGQITVEGPFYDAQPVSTLAVTGGTGSYKNPRGELVLKTLAGGTKFRFTFNLQP